ncbi:DUF3606 domain-containing protein [Bradyrhizobium sp. 190]|uniref:DUF3606 domain-containing protein n=1 Tax=Bradyrhizobium sp. 190 TaxID=2782658 RepID=UPI001FFB3C0A|nr:DUF3606 domain-containing protein [Bradyrhizobium sp. 190]
MPTSLGNKGEAIPARDEPVDTEKPDRVQYWTDRFGCTEEQLKAAIAAVGPMASKVEVYVKGQ